MVTYKIEQSDSEIISHAGLSLIGQAINQYTDLSQDAEACSILQRSSAISHADILRSYIGLLSIGKSDFEAINGFRQDDFFLQSLGLKRLPSEGTLRQRMDALSQPFLTLVQEASITFLQRSNAEITPLDNGWVALDADVSPFDNGDTQRQGVSRTYKKGVDGYAPMAAYLGQEGYCLEWELREGSQHCQQGTPDFLRRVLRSATALTDQPKLLRLDGGNDAIENIQVVEEHNALNPQDQTDYLIKWNPRREDPQAWLDFAKQHGRWFQPREGKQVALCRAQVEREHAGQPYSLQLILRVVERTMDRKGQQLLIPDIQLEGWWTSLQADEEEIIQLYADHGTSEQFHSEFKTDLDVERFPSGKFDTNALVLACAQLTYNILRWIGQNTLVGVGSPIRHPAKRRRIRTVMQEIMYLAAKVVRSARQTTLAFGKTCHVVWLFSILYGRFNST